MTFKISDIELGMESPEFIKEVIGKDARLLKLVCYHQCKDGITMNVGMTHKDFDEDNSDVEKCDNCEEQEVKNKGDWCDDCNLPENSHPFNSVPKLENHEDNQEQEHKVGSATGDSADLTLDRQGASTPKGRLNPDVKPEQDAPKHI